MIHLHRGNAGATALITEPGKVADARACYDACLLLEKHYPGHVWRVTIDSGVMQIRMGAFRGPFAYVIHLDRWGSGTLDAEIVRGGGEFMERNAVARGGRRVSTYDPYWFGHIKQAKR